MKTGTEIRLAKRVDLIKLKIRTPISQRSFQVVTWRTGFAKLLIIK